MSTTERSKPILLGRVTGLYGVKGWIKVHSYTHPRENIVNFRRWTLRQGDDHAPVAVEDGRPQGRTVVAKLLEIDDRDEARALIGADVTVERGDLPPCEPGEYYWVDLEGLGVRTVSGDDLGRVDYLFSSGAHDILVVAGDRQRLIPFVMQNVIHEIDARRGLIVVDWDSEF